MSKPIHEHDCDGCTFLGTDQRGKGGGARKFQIKPKWWAGMPTKEVSKEVYAAARMRYPAPEWVVLEEIENPERGNCRRFDIVAISVRGAPRVVVLEIKASRSDFLNEIRDPSKREPGMRLGTEFLYVVPTGLIDKSEVPDGCGLLEVQSGRTAKQSKVGTQKSSVEWSPHVVHSMIGKLMRREDPEHKMMTEIGSEAPKVFRKIFKLAGENMEFSDLMFVVRAMRRGHDFRIKETQLATEDYEDRKDKDSEVAGLRALRDAVREKCGYKALSAKGFLEWFGEGGGETSNPDFVRNATFLLNQVKRTADKLLSEIEGEQSQEENLIPCICSKNTKQEP